MEPIPVITLDFLRFAVRSLKTLNCRPISQRDKKDCKPHYLFSFSDPRIRRDACLIVGKELDAIADPALDFEGMAFEVDDSLAPATIRVSGRDASASFIISGPQFSLVRSA